ncbi:MAG: hypothetical protein N2688_01795 [Burkholderiaceae bacterium]|nr:hypothetical protein [Burkholderiaceae bacterium]
MSDDVILIALTGRAGAGKDTAARYLCERYGFVQASFAGALKEMCLAWAEYVGVDHAWFTERDLKEKPMPGFGFSARRMMQTLGTEWGRALMPMLWVAGLQRHLGLHEGGTPVHDRIVISDCRFPNEAQWVIGAGGTLVRVLRDVGDVAPHESEAHSAHLPAQHELHNVGSIGALEVQIDVLMHRLGVAEREPVCGTGAWEA